MIKTVSHSEAETVRLAADVALGLRQGDLVFLIGDLGVGKSVFARAVIRALALDPQLDVPSPTYTLCQNYDTTPPVAHFDLYRLSGADALDELGWEDMLEQGIVLMEWPYNCFDALPGDAIAITIEQTSDDIRELEISGNPETLERIARSQTIGHFLEQIGKADLPRQFLSGDASSRSYELVGANPQFLLMNSPAMPDGPVIKDGKPYSQIAHLAETVSAFVGVAEILREAGVRTPVIHDQDLEQGLLLTEFFGDEEVIDDDRQPIAERYEVCVELLADLHCKTVSTEFQLTNGDIYQVPQYDRDAMLIEVDLLKQWYLPEMAKPGASLKGFEELWLDLIDKLTPVPKTLVMRDFHSPNLLWLGDEKGINRVGVIDFQDAVIGPEAYDLASLAQDARVNVSLELETHLLDYYCSLRNGEVDGFDEAQFRESYAIMAAQRATKILGIFVRLDLRDGKPQYRNHIPRVRDYLNRSLNHPVLHPYGDWLSSVIEL